MALDSLKQTGIRLRQTQDDTDYTLRRFGKNFPQIERLRDSFDSTHPCIMEFKIFKAENTVLLSIYFIESFEVTC